MKSLTYICIACFCAWLIFEPKDNYITPELPETQLFFYNTKLPKNTPEIDSLINKVEKNLIYLKSTQK